MVQLLLARQLPAVISQLSVNPNRIVIPSQIAITNQIVTPNKIVIPNEVRDPQLAES
jgi:hypothetical protein